jgi:hypothetical protein
MKHLHLKKIYFCLLFQATLVVADATVVPLLNYRSQGQDLAREISGWSPYVNLVGDDCNYGAFAITAEYAQSFNNAQIAQCLFGDLACCNSKCPLASVKISGSRVTNRGAQDWLADYFYLPTDFQSVVTFTPSIQNAIFDLNFFMGLDKWVNGLYVKFQAPIVWSNWELNMQESLIDRGVNNYDPGYFDSFVLAPTVPDYPLGVGTFRDVLLESFSAYIGGDTVVTNTTSLDTQLKFAKISACREAKTTLADIHLTLGYNFLNCDNYHFGLGLRLVAPTGSRPDGEFFFEPMIGNGKFWEIGAHITSHAALWTGCDDTINLNFYADATITHMMSAEQRRTFDLKGKPFSRYMLAQQLGTPIINGLGGTNNPPVGAPLTGSIAQFQEVFTPLANISTLDVRVSIAIQAELAAQLTFGWNNMRWDLGYNFWTRSCEKIKSDCPSAPCKLIAFEEDKWGLKGDAYVFGFTPITQIPVALSATQSNATIHSGTNAAQGFDPLVSPQNPQIDNPQFAVANANTILPVPLSSNMVILTQTRTSIQPVFLTSSDLDTVGTRGISHKIYSNLSYNWLDHECWIPYLGIGGFAEFGSNGACSTNCAPNPCSSNCTTSCLQCSLSQWGVWLKGGVSF